MCYSAKVEREFKMFVRATGSKMDIRRYVEGFWWDQVRDSVTSDLVFYVHLGAGWSKDGSPQSTRENSQLIEFRRNMG